MLKTASLFGLLEQLDDKKVAVKQNRCILVRNRNASCLRCAKACTTGCISYDEDAEEVRVSSQKCIGCGACATACPTGALAPKDPDDSELLRQMSQKTGSCDGRTVVACSQLLGRAADRVDSGKVTEVPCLGRIDEGLALALVAMGSQAVTLVHGDCASCPHSQGLETVLMVKRNADTLLETWGSEVRLKVTAKLPSTVRRSESVEFDEGRRDFFKSAADSSTKAVVAVAESRVSSSDSDARAGEAPKYARVGADGVLPQSLPNRRRRLNAALKALGQPADEMIDTRLWGHVVIDEQACTGCRMCATFCPTGALRRFDEEEAMGVTHAPSLCVKCRLCESICPAQAIEISELVFAVDMLKGEVDRYEMTPPAAPPDNPHQIHRKMRTLLTCDQVYER